MTDWRYFREQLLGWYRPERRPTPWKEEPDPYRIWLSEIILQQTRVEQGLPYYERFVAAYPTVEALAAAPDDDVMKLWEGLGYYSRARNLLRAARMVAGELGGNFPATYNGLRALPGVGPYTAAAIGSFAFGLPVAVLDGNVYRVLSRYADDATPIDGSGARKHFQPLADVALGEADPARFNQAIMDFGALVCTPKSPLCARCPLSENCAALAAGTVLERPVKAKKVARRDRFLHFLHLTDGEGRTLVERRGEDDIWAGLYQFPVYESLAVYPTGSARRAGRLELPIWTKGMQLQKTGESKPYRHQLSHQRILAVIHRFTSNATSEAPEGTEWATPDHFQSLAMPRLLTRYLDDLKRPELF